MAGAGVPVPAIGDPPHTVVAAITPGDNGGPSRLYIIQTETDGRVVQYTAILESSRVIRPAGPPIGRAGDQQQQQPLQ